MEKIFDIKKRNADGSIMLSDSVYTGNIQSVMSYSVVRESESARLDKICKKQSLPTSMIDAVMYANNIINPFSISENDILIIPSSDNNMYEGSGDIVFKTKSKSSLTDYVCDTNETDKFIELTVKANNVLKSTSDENRQKRIEAIRNKIANTNSIAGTTSLNKRSEEETSQIQSGQGYISLNNY